jgi:hypothetical protein
MAAKIKESLRQEDEEDPKQLRQIVLVGRGIQQDLLVLTALGIGIELDFVAPRVHYLDTTCIAQKVLRGGSALWQLLERLNCPNRYLHNASNDANFTLRALLLLIARGCQAEILSEAEQAMISRLFLC